MIGQTRYMLVSHPKEKFRTISLSIKYQRKLVLMKMGNGEEAGLMPAALVTAGLEPFPPIGALSHPRFHEDKSSNTLFNPGSTSLLIRKTCPRENGDTSRYPLP